MANVNGKCLPDAGQEERGSWAPRLPFCHLPKALRVQLFKASKPSKPQKPVLGHLKKLWIYISFVVCFGIICKWNKCVTSRVMRSIWSNVFISTFSFSLREAPLSLNIFWKVSSGPWPPLPPIFGEKDIANLWEHIDVCIIVQSNIASL